MTRISDILAGVTIRPADEDLRPTRKPRNQGVPELDDHVWEAFVTDHPFDVWPVPVEAAHAVKLAAQKSAGYLSRVRQTLIRVTVTRIQEGPGMVRVRIAAHTPLLKGAAVVHARTKGRTQP